MEIDPVSILLVEDDPNDAELIQLALDEFNFVNRMEIAEDGEAALRYLLGDQDTPPVQQLPHLVLLDLKLPKVGGIEVLKRSRDNNTTRNLVVVVMTSSAEDQDLRACYDLGVNSYVVKPLDFQQFLEVAKQIGFYWMLLNRTPHSFT